jgi:hypothetical protein
MSRMQRYIFSRVLVCLGAAVGFAALMTGGIGLSIQSGNTGCTQEYGTALARQQCLTNVHPIFIACACGLAFAILAFFAGARMDPREPWEKASGSPPGELPAGRDTVKIAHEKLLAQQEAEIFGVRAHHRRGRWIR